MLDYLVDHDGYDPKDDLDYSDLLKSMASVTDRISYVNDAAKEEVPFDEVVTGIASGQILEKQEVMSLVFSWHEENLNDILMDEESVGYRQSVAIRLRKESMANRRYAASGTRRNN